jgi:hypothetical protein
MAQCIPTQHNSEKKSVSQRLKPHSGPAQSIQAACLTFPGWGNLLLRKEYTKPGTYGSHL